LNIPKKKKKKKKKKKRSTRFQLKIAHNLTKIQELKGRNLCGGKTLNDGVCCEVGGIQKRVTREEILIAFFERDADWTESPGKPTKKGRPRKAIRMSV
jgi:hypothetical protein